MASHSQTSTAATRTTTALTCTTGSWKKNRCRILTPPPPQVSKFHHYYSNLLTSQTYIFDCIGAKTKISDETESPKKKPKRRRKKKKTITDKQECTTATDIHTNNNPISEEAKIEGKTSEVHNEPQPGNKNEEKPNKKKKKRGNKDWKDKYERFYKNKKKFNLDIIRSEDGPFLFKIQLQYIPKQKNKKGPKLGNENKYPSDPNGNSMDGDKLKQKVLNFFKSSQQKVETENPANQATKPKIQLNYDKLKIGKPVNDQIKVFVTVFSREDGLQIYDYFYKLRSIKFNSAVYMITSTEILKKHTMTEIYKHKEKCKL